MSPRLSVRCLVLTAPPFFHANFSSAACLSALQPPTLLLVSCHQLPTLYWVASSTLIRLPVPLPGTARFHVQESFVWFRAKTDSSALAANPHSATYLPLLPLSFILNKLHHDLTTSKKKTRTFTGNKNRNYKILKGFGRPLKKIINNITTPHHHTHKKNFFQIKKTYCWIKLFHLALL